MEPNIFSHIRKFVYLSDEEVEILHTYIQIKDVKKKAILLSEGDICKSNYFVQKGCLRMYFINEKGVEQTTHFGLENWWLSDYMSLMNQKPSPFYIQAIEHSEILCLDYIQQENLMKALPQMEKYFRIVFEKAYAASQFRMKLFYGLSREELFLNFTTGFPEFVQRIPQYMLASYLGITPEYLSELRKKHP